MKRDMELIKEIMIRVEEDNFDTNIEGYDKQIVLNHMKMLIDAGFLDGVFHMNTEGRRPVVSNVHIKDITWQGYDFLELLKDDEKFAFLKDIGKKLSFEVLKDAVKTAITTALT
jgi:hypothetical protein